MRKWILAAVLFGVASPVLAQPAFPPPIRGGGPEARRDWRENQREARQEWQRDQREARRDRRENLRNGDRREARREWREDQFEARRDWRGNQQDARREWRDDRRDWRNDRRDRPGRWQHGWRNERHFERRDWRRQHRQHYRGARWAAPRGHYYRHWQPGWRADPWLWHDRRWLISQPWQYHLPQTPHFLRWVRYYDDAVLIDVRNGYVVDVIRQYFW
jgi:hypothetical protein